jgi:hypothetical protein
MHMRNTNFDKPPNGGSGSGSGQPTTTTGGNTATARADRSVSTSTRNTIRNRRFVKDPVEGAFSSLGGGFTTMLSPTEPSMDLATSTAANDHLQTFINSSITNGVATNRIVLFTTDNGGGLKSSVVRIDQLGCMKGVKDLDITGNITVAGNLLVSPGGNLRINDDPVHSNDAATKGYVDTLFSRYREELLSKSLCNVDSIPTSFSTAVVSQPSSMSSLYSDYVTSTITPTQTASPSVLQLFNEFDIVTETSIGLNPKAAVTYATTEPLPDCELRTKGANGIGDCLIGLNPAKLLVDGCTPVVGDRVLIKDEPVAEKNGVYTIQDLGSPQTTWTLVRSTDYDQPREIPLGYFFVKDGTLNKNTTWVNMNKAKVCLGITPIVFTMFSNVGEMKAGRGIFKDGNELRVNLDTDSLIVNRTNKIMISPDYQGQPSISLVGKIAEGEWASSTPVSAAHGGTGHKFMPKNRVLVGNGEGPLEFKPSPKSDFVGTSDQQILENKILIDSTTALQDPTKTRQVQFCLIDITPGTNRVFNLPDCNTTLVGTDNASTIRNKFLDASNQVIAGYLKNEKDIVVKILGTKALKAGQVLCIDENVDGVHAIWKDPMNAVDFENIGETGVGIFRQKIDNVAMLKRLYSKTPAMVIDDIKEKNRIDFKLINEELDLNSLGKTPLGVMRGGLGFSKPPYGKVVVGGVNEYTADLTAPKSEIVGISDTQELSNKSISGIKNAVSSGALAVSGRELKIVQPTKVAKGDVLTVDGDSCMSFKPLPPAATIGSVGGTNTSVFFRTQGTTHMFRCLQGENGIEITTGQENQLLVSLKMSGVDINTFSTTPLKVERGGTGLKVIPSNKVLVGGPVGAGVLCEKDAPLSNFVGTTDKQELKNKIITDHSNTVCSSMLFCGPKHRIKLVGDSSSPAKDTVLTSMGLSGDSTTAEWRPVPKALTVRARGGTISGMLHKDENSDILEYKGLAPKSNCIDLEETDNEILVDVIEGNIDLNHVGGILGVEKGGTGAVSFHQGCVLVGNGVGEIQSTKLAPKGSFVGTTDMQTLEHKIIRAPNNVVTASFLRSATGDIQLGEEYPPEVGYILKVIEPGVAGWRPASDDNPEVLKYQALFKPTVAAVEALRSENQALKMAISKLNMHIVNMLDDIATLKMRNGYSDRS